MKPYKIEINWIDYNPTNDDDVYEVNIYYEGNEPVKTWTANASVLSSTLHNYLTKTSSIVD